MKDTDLYAQILGIKAPWVVTNVQLSLDKGEVSVNVAYNGNKPLYCPKCGKEVPRYDKRQRKWRHLDTCQYKTVLIADVPRGECKDHGIHTIQVPWSDSGSSFTALFEALVIDWLKEASIAAVARQLQLSWNAISGIMSRSVQRGLMRCESSPFERLSVDETSFRKRHDYVTIVSDPEMGRVLHVAPGRTKKDLKAFYKTLSPDKKKAIVSIAMDMWPAYISATLESIPIAAHKIAFDKFHVAKYLGDAVDKVRRQEQKKLRKLDCDVLTGTKHIWLTNPNNLTEQRWNWFKPLRESGLKTARAWALKEVAMSLWRYTRRGWATKAWKKWIVWAKRSRLEPMEKVAKTIEEHLWGIVNADVLNATNGPAESINSKIKMIKVRCRGFRNKERFANAIYFHLGGLDLYPDPVKNQVLPT